MNRDFSPSRSVLILALAFSSGACALAETPGEISSMSNTMTGMAGNVEAMNASLGVTNRSLGSTNTGLDAMDGRLAAMLQQLQLTRGSLDGMQDSLSALDVMVGQLGELQLGTESLADSMRTTNTLLGDVLVGINATSSGMGGMQSQLKTMLVSLETTNATLEGLGPKLIADAMPEVNKGLQAASRWLIPVVGSLAGAWLVVVALLWRIGGSTRTVRPETVRANRLTEALLDSSAGSR